MNIKKKRLEAGFTQIDLANKLEIDRSTVAKWETGESFPRAEKLIQLAEVLNCTIDELLKGA